MAVTLPVVGDSEGTWGTILNTAISDIDTRLITATNTNGTQDTTITSLTSRISALENKPAVKVVQNATQTISNNTATAITFTGAEELDTHGFHDPATNNTRITPTVAGWYWISGAVPFPSRTDWTMCMVYALLRGNAVNSAGRLGFTGSTNGIQVVSFTTLASFNGSTDYVEMVALAQNSAAATYQPVISGGLQSTLSLTWERGL